MDVVAFVQPSYGQECGRGPAPNLWSHRWTYGIAMGDSTKKYVTKDGVTISDYVRLPALNCYQPTTIDIGIFAHELGHALGLPDLYSTTDPPTNNGIGYWGLMAFGNWNKEPAPAFMEAWSRMQLGWLRVVPARNGRTYTLDPSNTAGSAVRVDIPNSPEEYFLLENRKRIGSDQYLPAPGGLLIWHVASTVIDDHWKPNTVQNNTAHLGISLVEADGRDDMKVKKNHGDTSDVFPGTGRNTELSPSSTPSSDGFGGASGITIGSIQEVGQQVRFIVEIHPPPVGIAQVPRGPPQASAAQVPGQGRPPLGPLALLRFSGPVTAADTANLNARGFRIIRVFPESNSIYAQIPANMTGNLSSISPRLVALDVQQRSARPPE